MPEGDTIYRSAQRLRQILPGRRIEAARGDTRFVEPESFIGNSFQAIEARGKHLLMHLNDRRILHSHMGMTGSWHLYAVDEPWHKPTRSAALAVLLGAIEGKAEKTYAVCFRPKVLELLTETALRRHRVLQRLGPDLMTSAIDEEHVLRRFRVHPFASIGEALLNQTIISGVGNVYKSECLFLCHMNPFQRVDRLADEELLRLVVCVQQLMQRNRAGGPRTTRFRGDDKRLWVYGRKQQPCLICGDVIQLQRQGDLGRTTYWCPTCQV